MPKTKSEDAKIDFCGNRLFCGQFPSLIFNVNNTAKAEKLSVVGIIKIYCFNL